MAAHAAVLRPVVTYAALVTLDNSSEEHLLIKCLIVDKNNVTDDKCCNIIIHCLNSQRTFVSRGSGLLAALYDYLPDLLQVFLQLMHARLITRCTYCNNSFMRIEFESLLLLAGAAIAQS